MSLLLPNASGHLYSLWSITKLFLSLDVCSHFSFVVAWSCCQPSWPIKRWKCKLWSVGSQLRRNHGNMREVTSLTVFFKIDSLVDHPVRGLFPAQCLLRRPTRGALAAHSRSFEMTRSRTVQFSRSFLLSCVRLWNGLHESVFAGDGVGAFKTSVNRFLLQDWLPAVSSFSSTISFLFFLFPGPKIAWGLRTYRLFAFTHVVFGIVFLGGVIVGSHVCFFRHGVRHLRLAMQSQLFRKLWFHLPE